MLSKMCEDIRAKIAAGIGSYNAALAKGHFKAMSSIESDVKEKEAEYATQALQDLCSEHKDDEFPVYSVLKQGFYKVFRHKAIREDGELKGWELMEAERQVDMKAMFTYFNRTDKVWQYRAERLTELLCEWAHQDVKGSSAGVIDSFKMSAKAKEIQVSANPTSNTSMLKLLQSTIDEIITVPDKDGKNTVKANNRDLKFLQHCYTKEGSGKNNLSTLKANGVIRVLGKVIYRIANDAAYDVDYKHIVGKDPVLEAQRAANLQAKEAKTEKTEVSDDVVVSRPNESEDAA